MGSSLKTGLCFSLISLTLKSCMWISLDTVKISPWISPMSFLSFQKIIQQICPCQTHWLPEHINFHFSVNAKQLFKVF